MENLLQSTSLVGRAYWLIRLRWIAIATLVIATFTAGRFMGVSLSARAIYWIAAAVLAYNVLLYAALRYGARPDKELSPRRIGQIITLQISADLVILTAILHFSGGIENPFAFFFVFHMVLASILRPKLQSYLQATLAVILFSGLVMLESSDRLLHHHELIGFAGHGLYKDPTYIVGYLFIFAITLYLVVYMTTSISAQLRKQQDNYEKANALLNEKDHLKNQYVLRLTHDIKGHLAAIESCINIVNEQIVGPLNPRQKDLVERASRRTSKCLAFVVALLKLTRMKLAGQPEMEPFSLRNCVLDAVTAVQRRAKEKSINVTYDIQASVDQIYGESVLIEETLTNILFNAVKYTPIGGQVRLSVADDNDMVLVRVTDTGIGIPEGDLTHIFEEFYRAPNARATERDGTGLGLSLAKQVVERHGGKIWAQNNPDVGSTFTLTLPKAPRES